MQTLNKLHEDLRLCQYIKERYPQIYLHASKLPAPYYSTIQDVKAIVLGTDPSNPQNLFFDYVFGLERKNSPYFKIIAENLNFLGFDVDRCYVQNLCKNYFSVVTGNNPSWNEVAELWRKSLKTELNEFFPSAIPVFITAWDLILVLSDNAVKEPACFYNNLKTVPSSSSFLERELILLFRHHKYKLSKWPQYVSFIKTRFDSGFCY